MHWTISGGEVALGDYRRGSRELLDVPDCPLLVDLLQQLVRRVHVGTALQQQTHDIGVHHAAETRLRIGRAGVSRGGRNHGSPLPKCRSGLDSATA